LPALSTLQTWTLVYLGTTATDKAFPSATLNILINNAVNALLDDINEQAPGWLEATDTLQALLLAGHGYRLPTNFSKWSEVRLRDKDGAELREVRSDELNSTGEYVFCLTGPDENGVLTTSDTVPPSIPLYLKYRAWPSLLANPSDTPDMIPSKYHDLIAMTAAEEGMGLGGEGALPSTIIRRKEDRHAQLMMHVSRRGAGVASTR
jgi:hypothetical protein